MIAESKNIYEAYFHGLTKYKQKVAISSILILNQHNIFIFYSNLLLTQGIYCFKSFLFNRSVKGFLLLFAIIAVFVWIYPTSLWIILSIKVEINLKIYFAYKVLSKTSKKRILSKKLYKRVINMISRDKIVRRLKSVVAVEINRGIQTPSFALI